MEAKWDECHFWKSNKEANLAEMLQQKSCQYNVTFSSDHDRTKKDTARTEIAEGL